MDSLCPIANCVTERIFFRGRVGGNGKCDQAKRYLARSDSEGDFPDDILPPGREPNDTVVQLLAGALVNNPDRRGNDRTRPRNNRRPGSPGNQNEFRLPRESAGEEKQPEKKNDETVPDAFPAFFLKFSLEFQRVLLAEDIISACVHGNHRLIAPLCDRTDVDKLAHGGSGIYPGL